MSAPSALGKRIFAFDAQDNGVEFRSVKFTMDGPLYRIKFTDRTMGTSCVMTHRCRLKWHQTHGIVLQASSTRLTAKLGRAILVDLHSIEAGSNKLRLTI